VSASLTVVIPTQGRATLPRCLESMRTDLQGGYQAEILIVADTHSPLLMAFPGATILSFDTTPVSEVAYADTEHVSLTRAFLNDPASFLRRL